MIRLLPNVEGIAIVAEQQWLCKKDAVRFFARMSYRRKLYGDSARLSKAVEDGRVRTRAKGKRVLYNMLDCMQNCRIL